MSGRSREDGVVVLDTADLGFLGQAVTPATPPEGASRRILARVLARIGQDASAPSLSMATRATAPGLGVIVDRAEDAQWREVCRGVDMRLLHDDGRFRSMLLRFAAGATLPEHGHDLEEECVVLEGEVWLAGVLMRQGDYQRIAPGVVHPEARSDGGCVVHIRAQSARTLTAYT